jgi:ubiquinone/menaquinone biosynthesis C-methylase UbiE
VSDPQAVFYAAFDGLERLAPGSDATTLRALERVQRIVEPRRILDIGCGSGAQTLVLARNTAAEIVAVDSHAPFLTALMDRARAAGVAARVQTCAASMAELRKRFSEDTFDVLWAEGSIYVIGFDRGLTEWRGLLNTGGVLACSEAAWLTESPSEDVRVFWSKEYPAMRGVNDNIVAAQRLGYECVDHFVLPASDWLESYYGPLERQLAKLRVKYAGDAAAEGVLDMSQAEIDLYRRAGREYGYVFYLLQRADRR